MKFCKYLNMCSLLSLLCILLIFNISFAEESKKLLFVQSLFRHGDRAPGFLYPNNPNKEDSWPEGLIKLTRLGKKQHYALGKFIRSMYKDFVTSNPNEVFVNSTPTERSLSSAQAHLAGLYEPEGRWKFEDKLNWQPIPIYTKDNNKYPSFFSNCPRANALFNELKESCPKTDEFRKHQILLETLSDYSGLNLSQGINALYLFDNLKIEKIHNLTIPGWANTYWDVLEEIEQFCFHYIINPPALLRLRIGPLLQKITENMMKKICGEIPDLKFQVYSAHDAQVAGVLIALNFTDMPRPPYCATVLFELHEMTDNTKAVRLLYLNSTDPMQDIETPHVLVLDGCYEFCPIEIFIKKIEHWIPDNWEQECKLDTSETRTTNKTSENVRPLHKTDAVANTGYSFGRGQYGQAYRYLCLIFFIFSYFFLIEL